MSKSNQWVMGETDQRFAWLEDDTGMNVACMERLPNRYGPRGVMPYNTTDEHWQAIIDVIAAAPEMLSVLKRAESLVWGNMYEVEEFLKLVRAAVAKAEPPRVVPVKRKVTITTEVEIEVFSDAPDDMVMKLAEGAVRSGIGNVTCKRVIV
jgi:hypothetical protein